MTVGDALNDDKVVIEPTSDQLCPAVSHEDNVFMNLAEGGVFGSVIGDVAQANADEREQNQKTTDEFHANRNIFHCRLRVMDESKLHQVWSIHFEQLRTNGSAGSWCQHGNKFSDFGFVEVSPVDIVMSCAPLEGMITKCSTTRPSAFLTLRRELSWRYSRSC